LKSKEVVIGGHKLQITMFQNKEHLNVEDYIDTLIITGHVSVIDAIDKYSNTFIKDCMIRKLVLVNAKS